MAPFPCIATNTSPPLGGGAKKRGGRATKIIIAEKNRYPVGGYRSMRGRRAHRMTQLLQNISTVSRSAPRLPLLIRTRSSMAFWSLANATTKAAAAATAFLLELANSRLLLFVRHTDEVAVRMTTQVASGMIHLMAVGTWIWGSSFLFPQALIPLNSGW